MRISNERFHDLVARCVHFIQAQIDKEVPNTDFMTRAEISWGLTKTIHDGNVAALHELGLILPGDGEGGEVLE